MTLVGSPRLAELAEAELQGRSRSTDAEIAAEIAPCFVEADGARTDTIVLACTHYPLLLDRLERLAPWPVQLIDPAPAIARRVVDLLGPPAAGAASLPARAVFTSGRRAGAHRSPRRLARFGLAESRPCRRLTPPANTPKNRPSRGPFGPRGVSRPAVLQVFAKTFALWLQNLSVPANAGTKEGAILKPELNMRTR